MQIQISLRNQREQNLNLVKTKQYLEALDRYKVYLSSTPHHLPDILISLYKELYKFPSDLNIRLIITELYIKYEYFDDACIEIEEMMEINLEFSQTYYLLSKIYSRNYNSLIIKRLFQHAFDQGVRDSVLIDCLPKLYLDANDSQSSILFFETLLKENEALPHHNKALAALYKQTGKYEKSISIYSKLVEKEPEFLKDACALGESILDAHPQLHKIRQQLAHFYIKDCNPDQATHHITRLAHDSEMTLDILDPLYKTVLSIYPAHPETLHSYCTYLLDQDLITDAVSLLDPMLNESTLHHEFIRGHFDTLVAKCNTHPGLHCFLIRWHISQQEYAEALSIVEWFLTDSCSNSLINLIKPLCISIWELTDNELKVRASYCLAQLLYAQKKYSDTLSYCDHCGDNHLLANVLKITILLDQNNLTDSKKIITNQLKTQSQFTVLHQLSYRLHQQTIKNRFSQTSLNTFDDILCFMLMHDTHHAIEAIQQITPDHTEYSLAQLLLVRCFMQQQKSDHSLQLLQNIIPFLKENHHPHYESSLFLQAICYIHRGLFKKASSVLRTIEQININHSYSKTLNNLLYKTPFSTNRGHAVTGLIDIWNGTIYVTSLPNSEESTSSSTINTISFGLNHNNQAADYLLNHNTISARSELEISCQLDPSLTAAHCNLALAHIIDNQLDDVVRCLSLIPESQANSDLVCITKGLLFYKQGNLQDAITQFKHAYAFNPSNLHARYNLAMIYFLKDNVGLSCNYLDHLNQYGLFFTHIQHHFFYLEKQFFIINDWISPKHHYEFQAFST